MKRPNQHVIETTSTKAFEALLPDEWVPRQLFPDYGIDYMVEIFRENKSTGKFFYVQLKGTSQKIKDLQPRINVKVSSLEYFKSIPLPILFVVYSTQVNRFWGLWINDYLASKKIKQGTKTLQLKFDQSQIIDDKFFRDLEASYCIEAPQKINVAHSSDHGIGESYHRMLKKWLEEFYPDLLVFDDDHFPKKIHFRYSYRSRHLHIEATHYSLGTYGFQRIPLDQKADFLNYPTADYSEIPEEIRESLFFVATTLAEQDISVSLNLYRMLICAYSGKFKKPTVLLNVASIAIEEYEIAGLQELIEKALECKNYEDFEFLNVAYLFHKSKLKTFARDFYKQNLQKAISSVEDDDDLKSMFSYNLANAYRTDGTRYVKEALKCYLQAKRLQPDYLNRGYWWFELAGVLFEMRRYKWAKSCYLKSDELSKDFRPLIFAYIGDCLFFQGRFATAKKQFDRYLKGCRKPLSGFCLKALAGQLLIDNGLDGVKRNPQSGLSLAGRATKEKTDTKQMSMLEKALRYDPLCGFAWFNLAVCMNRLKKYKNSFWAFLICALIQPWDRDAWLNALFLSLNLKKHPLFLHLLDTVKAKFGSSILKDIVDFVKKQPHLSRQEKSGLVSMLKKLLDKLDRTSVNTGSQKPKS